MVQICETRVFVDEQKSDSFKMRTGVRQGECISSCLFEVYANMILEKKKTDVDDTGVTDVIMLLLYYAGDSVISSETST